MPVHSAAGRRFKFVTDKLGMQWTTGAVIESGGRKTRVSRVIFITDRTSFPQCARPEGAG